MENSDKPGTGEQTITPAQELFLRTMLLCMGNTELTGDSSVDGFMVTDAGIKQKAQNNEFNEQQRAEKTRLELALAELNKFLDQLDALIAHLLKEIDEHYNKAQEHFEYADRLEDLLDSLKAGAPLTPEQQDLHNKIKKSNPNKTDAQIEDLIQREMERQRELGREQNNQGQDKEKKVEDITQLRNEAKTLSDKLNRLVKEGQANGQDIAIIAQSAKEMLQSHGVNLQQVNEVWLNVENAEVAQAMDEERVDARSEREAENNGTISSHNKLAALALPS